MSLLSQCERALRNADGLIMYDKMSKQSDVNSNLER